MRRQHWLIPLAALIALLPMVLAGPSYGKDFVFHLSSWLGAADQMRHGMWWPRWDFLAAYNAGEPRFVFYPPLSWMLGALLSFVLPVAALPFMMAWICMTTAGFSMHRLASRYASANGALLAACLYLANPWMLFTVLERAAWGELFAAAFCPWLMAAMLEERPEAARIALPLGLIWLSNTPGAILCTYLLGLVLVYRVVRERRPAMIWGFGAGLVLAIALDAVSFLPALVQRKYIDVEGAFPEGFRPIDNLSFFRTLPSDPFFVQTQHLALLLFLAAVLFLLVKKSAVRPVLLVVAVGVAFSMTVFAKPFWMYLPAVWVVQFPWRAIFLLAAVAALAIGIALERVPSALAVVAALVLSVGAVWAFQVRCSPEEMPAALAKAMLVDRHNSVPINEYVVVSGDSELMRPDNPPFWVAAKAADFAPGTIARVEDFDPAAAMPRLPSDLRLSATPMNFEVSGPGFLVINLQDYPNWMVRLNGVVARRAVRPDGLVAVELPGGLSRVDIRWRYAWDEWVGLGITLLTLPPIFLIQRYRLKGLRSGLRA